MHTLLERLGRDHKNLERILELLTLQLDHFFAGRESDFDLKVELLEYLETYADLGHHPLENLIYDTGKKRVGDKLELLERLQSQHDSLTMLTRKFRQSLESVLQGGVMSREELETEGREFIALQRQHLDLEEHEVFPLLDRVLTEEDWASIEQNIPPHDDPVFEAPDKIRFQTLLSYLERSEAE